MPKYLIAFNDEWVPEHTADELERKSAASRAVLEEMKAAGVFVFADGGIDASTAVCSVVSKDGRPVFTDGPYVETKEHLGGFTVVDVPDDEAARHWAGRLAVGTAGLAVGAVRLAVGADRVDGLLQGGQDPCRTGGVLAVGRTLSRAHCPERRGPLPPAHQPGPQPPPRRPHRS